MNTEGGPNMHSSEGPEVRHAQEMEQAYADLLKVLKSHLNEQNAAEAAVRLKGWAQERDRLVWSLSREPEIARNYSYDGVRFVFRNNGTQLPLLDGVGLLKNIAKGTENIFRGTTQAQGNDDAFFEWIEERSMSQSAKDLINHRRSVLLSDIFTQPSEDDPRILRGGMLSKSKGPARKALPAEPSEKIAVDLGIDPWQLEQLEQDAGAYLQQIRASEGRSI